MVVNIRPFSFNRWSVLTCSSVFAVTGVPAVARFHDVAGVPSIVILISLLASPHMQESLLLLGTFANAVIGVPAIADIPPVAGTVSGVLAATGVLVVAGISALGR